MDVMTFKGKFCNFLSRRIIKPFLSCHNRKQFLGLSSETKETNKDEHLIAPASAVV